MLISTNPFTQKVLAEFPSHTPDEMENFLVASQEATLSWPYLSFTERGQYLLRVADILLQKKEELARISTEEMGMLFIDACGDIEKTVANIHMTVERAEEWLQTEKIPAFAGMTATIQYDPLGTILVIAPWNYPYNQALRNTIPQLMAGNCVLLKHASNLPRVSQALQNIFDAAGVPAGVFQTLLLRGSETDDLIADPRIAGVAITSWENAGRAVGTMAGKYLKPSVLELGGNDPCIVLSDASDDEAVKIITKWRLANGGQKCNAIKRLILIGERTSLVEKLVETFTDQTLGDPMDATTQIPPLVDAKSVAEMHDMVSQAVEAGGKILVGGEMITIEDVSRPQFYLPTILTNISRENPVYDYEFFWPVLVLHQVDSLDDAIQVANDSRYGLGAVVIGHDKDMIHACAWNIRAGNIAINQPVTSYPDLPYGGMRDSGYGREMGQEGIRAFMNVRVVTSK